jgi:hypothetical protein
MKIIENKKKKIHSILNDIISNNKFIYDIWVYGNFTDKISDLDLIIIYKNNPKEIVFSHFIKKLVADGTVIYIGYKKRNDVFLFDDIKTYSIKRKKLIRHKISSNFKRFRCLTSFLERYYERSTLLQEKRIAYLTDINLRNIKSLFFCYKNFFRYFKNLKEEKEKFNNIEKIYNILRKDHSKKKLKKNRYKNFLDVIKIFNKNFYNLSLITIEKKFQIDKVPNFVFKFKKKIFFSNKSNNKKVLKVPNLFFYIFYFYSKQTYKISKLISKDFKIKNKKNINFSKNLSLLFIRYLKKKIIFINTNFISLRKNNFTSGLYKFTWYLNKT